MASNSITLTLRNSKGGIERQFESGTFPNSQLWQQAETLLNDKSFIKAYGEALAEIHGIQGERKSRVMEIVKKEAKQNKKAYTNPEPMQSYWTDLFHTLQVEGTESDRKCFIGVKACRNHYFYNLQESTKDKGRARLLCTPFFENSAPPEIPSKKQNRRGLTDTILFLGPELSNNRGRLVEYLSWFDLTLHCIVRPRSPSDPLVLEISPEFNAPSKCINIGEKQVLVISPNFREAITELSEVWLNPKAKSVLLCAWTGSGKERLVDILAYASRIDERNRVNTSAASLNQFERLIEKMIEYKNDLLLYPEHTERPNPDHRSILFIDEIHHKSSGSFRSGLLRHLSSGRLEEPNPQLLCDAVLYVLAASEQRESLQANTEPKDLWTRMEHTVTLKHPLNIQEEEQRRVVLKEYFLFFWIQHEKAYQKATQGTTYSSANILSVLEKEAQESQGQSILRMLADNFVTIMDSPLLPLMSIRLLETMVKRLFYKTQTYVRRNPPQVVADELGKKFEGWVRKLKNELVPELESEALLRQRGIF